MLTLHWSIRQEKHSQDQAFRFPVLIDSSIFEILKQVEPKYSWIDEPH